MVPFVPKHLPDLSKKSVLLAGGLRDQLIPREQTMRLLDLLSESHAEVTIHWEESTHALDEQEILFARDWISKLRPQG